MKYRSRLTSKGTTTIPAEIRKRLGFKPGMVVLFRLSDDDRAAIVERVPTIEEIRAQNKIWLKRAGTWNKPYYSGAGIEAYVMEKYGKKKRRA